MNTGAEAVETALKVARKWGYRVKGVPENTASIVVMEGNFHGRTTTIVSFSDDKIARDEYGPYTPGFRTVTYGDADALRQAIDDTTVAVLLEPVQGEGGVVIPPEGYLRAVRAICDEAGALMIADEIQSGLARTGRTFACDHEDVVPDIYVLGKALGGGLYPVSAIAADREVLEVITPGSHGSTFGGNPLAAAIGHEVVTMLAEGDFQARAAAPRRGARRPARAARGPPRRRRPRRRARARAVGRPRHRARRAERARAVRAADEPRHPRQGHPRVDHPHRAAARRHRGRGRHARRRRRRRPAPPVGRAAASRAGAVTASSSARHARSSPPALRRRPRPEPRRALGVAGDLLDDLGPARPGQVVRHVGEGDQPRARAPPARWRCRRSASRAGRAGRG